MNRDEMLKALSAMDFYAVDMALYLDTHPDDNEALARYNAIVREANTLRQSYEQQFGPMYSYRSTSAAPWQWINDPWPWHAQFNFMLGGDDK
jgi:spore coat protein JB